MVYKHKLFKKHSGCLLLSEVDLQSLGTDKFFCRQKMLPKNRRTTTRYLTIFKYVLKPTIAIDATYYIAKTYGNDMYQWK